jgi:hypothetical protein
MPLKEPISTTMPLKKPLSPQAPHKLTADSFLSRPKTPDEMNVWTYSANLAKGALESYGNVLSADHWHAIQALADVLTAVASGAVEGRYAVALPTGLGKSLMAVMFCTALDRLQRPESVVICCEKVQQLITMKRELLHWGVDESKIGLWYSKDYRTPDGKLPSEPRTEKPEERQFLLLTHARARGKTELSKLNVYHGEPRSCWIYDESLLASSHVSFDYHAFARAASWFRTVADLWKIRSRYPRLDRLQKARLQRLADYLDNEVVPAFKAELLAQVQQDRAPQLLHLPAVASDLVEQWRFDLMHVWGRTAKTDGGKFASTLQKFRRMIPQSAEEYPLRLVALDGGESAVVSFAVVVPKELQRLVVLDASYPVRLLENMDRSITHITGFEDIKDWSRVTFTIEDGPSGRDPISANFAEHARWAIEKVKQYGSDPVLVLTFKDRPDSEDLEKDERLDYRKRESRMVEKFQSLMLTENVEKPDRVQFLTFGNETSLSDYKHIPHVIFLGTLHRSPIDLAGATIGQSGSLLRLVEKADVWAASLGEQAHGVYQGSSRGTCRTVINGIALPMTIDARHAKPHALWAALEPVMPGCTPILPPPPKVTSRNENAAAILAALKAVQGEGRNNISSRALKIIAGLAHLPKDDYSRAIEYAVNQQGESSGVAGWMKQDRSLIRAFTPTGESA